MERETTPRMARPTDPARAASALVSRKVREHAEAQIALERAIAADAERPVETCAICHGPIGVDPHTMAGLRPIDRACYNCFRLCMEGREEEIQVDTT